MVSAQRAQGLQCEAFGQHVNPFAHDERDGACALGAVAHVQRPVVGIEVEPVEVDVVDEPTREFEGAEPGNAKVDRSPEPRADRAAVGAALAGGVLVEPGGDAPDAAPDQACELRTRETIR
jgi:hypothetical protein